MQTINKTINHNFTFLGFDIIWNLVSSPFIIIIYFVVIFVYSLNVTN